MKSILIVCGAGASSTFLAQRIRSAANAASIAEGESPIAVIASSLQGLPALLPKADVVLVGPHLKDQFQSILLESQMAGVTALLLPDTIFGADGGEVALGLIRAAEAATDPV